MAMTREEYDLMRQNKSVCTNAAKSGYRVVLTPHFSKSDDMTEEQLKKADKDSEPIEFDLIDNISVSSSSNVTSYPMVNGDVAADHMIRQPDVVSISGTYSMYGNKPTSFDGEYDRLTNIEELFERIKNEGVLCDIATIDRKTNSKQRFKVRKNMALTSISWTEGQASLDFSFRFKQVFAVDLDEVSIDYSDENLPDITDAAALDFTDTLLDWSKIDMIVIYQLDSAGLMKKDFWPNFVYWLNTVGEAAGSYAIGGTALGFAAGITSLIAVSAIVGSVPVAGWVISAVIAGIGAVIGAVWALVNTIQSKNAERDYAIQAFEHYEDDEKNRQENIRFVNYIGSIHQQLEYLEDVLKVYGISKNSSQECMLYIDDTYYIFRFNKSNTQNSADKTVWNCSIYNANDDAIVKDVSDIASSSMSDISQCTSTNMLFRTTGGNGYYVYLVNKAMFSILNGTYNSDDERKDAIQKCNNDLTNFCIFVSSINMDDFNEKLKDIVVNAMKR